jgi:hypothetical protein
VGNAKRTRRLAQEIASLNNSLTLSPNGSIFVRTSEERLDVMKVGAGPFSWAAEKIYKKIDLIQIFYHCL